MCHRKGHLEAIPVIQQLLVESKLTEAQKALEVLLLQSNDSQRPQALSLYFEILNRQHKAVPTSVLLELAELGLSTDVEKSRYYLQLIPSLDVENNYRRYKFVEMEIASIKGNTEHLYQLISDYQLKLYELRVPLVPDIVTSATERYFKRDFKLKLQRLALTLLLNDLHLAEAQTIELIAIISERAVAKGVAEKFGALVDVLEAYEIDGCLTLYRNFSRLMAEGLRDKNDYKKLAELVIYFDEFRFQSHILNLLYRLELHHIAASYALDIRSNPKYDFIFYDKYYPHLKPLFTKIEDKIADPGFQKIDVDLKLLEASFAYQRIEEESPQILEEEVSIRSALKYGSYSENELLDIVTNLIQSDLYHAGVSASEMIKNMTNDNSMKLKASYLKLVCLLKLGDYRGALDLAMDSISLAQDEEDILCFLYAQADAYQKLKQKQRAIDVLQQIVSIRPDYRLAKERLVQLDEI
jgi:hypothetical protein